jgi:hypothetical protein
MWLNLAQLIRNRVPDRKGNTLPMDVSTVTYDLQDLMPGNHSLMANALAVDSELGLRVRHNYPICCGFSPGVVWDPDSFILEPDASIDGDITGMDQCSGDTDILTAYIEDWWSADTAVATVASPGNVTGVSAGTTTASAVGHIPVGSGGYCTVETVYPSAPVNVQVPTSATIISNDKQTYANQTWTSCDGTQSANNRYGYQRCVTYQVEDQNGNDIEAVLTISETITVVDPGNINATMSTGNSSTNVAGQFLDGLALLGSSALPSNACSIVQQSFTATGNSSPIRVNCIQYSSTDVTITNLTSNPASCSKPTYQCN